MLSNFMFFLPLMKHFSSDTMMMVIFLIILKTLMLNNDTFYSMMFFMDEMSLNMILMTCWIMMIVVLITWESKEILNLISSGMLIMLMFFCVNDVLLFFLMFEFSLLPIFAIVVGFGEQPERIKAGRWMMIYTIMASVPLFLFILHSYMLKGSEMLSMFSFCSDTNLFYSSNFVCMGLILAMLVKIPMFLFHSWLPKAHVEAPLQGSMILAGVMLKMGLFGMIRIMKFIPNIMWDLGQLIFSISMMGAVYSCWMAVNSDDVKVTVAYSSVSHMNFLISCIMSMKFSAIYSSIIIMISHGLCSSMLFFLMTSMYKYSHSRSVIVMKGLNSLFPVSVFFGFVNWSINLSAPPSLSFIGEVVGLSCIMSISILGAILSCLYIVINSFYSMFNFSIQCHSSSKISFKCDNLNIIVMISFFWMIMPLIILFFTFEISMI